MALGTPMLLAGDESCRTQNGNNNAYCQDNELSWIDWERAGSDEGRRMTEFVARVIALRKQHPLLRETRFLFGDREVLPGLLRRRLVRRARRSARPSRPGRTRKGAR